MANDSPFRALSLDGGGMRGTYTATYLAQLAFGFEKRRNVCGLDIGAGFDLIAGTSTGGIVGCALAAGVPLAKVIALYRDHGKAIFSKPLPRGIWGILSDLWKRPAALGRGAKALHSALLDQLGEQTLEGVYAERKIALAITAIDLGRHRSWVFKTPHLPQKYYRDGPYRLADVCMATSAAPVYRSLAAIPYPSGGGFNVFVDGGLWANNPVLVALIEALEMAEEGRPIEVYCLGSCSRPGGEQIAVGDVNRGLEGWKFGGEVASLAIAAQEFAFDQMAKMLSKHINRSCRIIRFPHEDLPAGLLPYLELDNATDKAIDALIGQARHDADMMSSKCNDPQNGDGQLICRLFEDMPLLEPGRAAPMVPRETTAA
jgi:hypothetical protein